MYIILYKYQLKKGDEMNSGLGGISLIVMIFFIEAVPVAVLISIFYTKPLDMLERWYDNLQKKHKESHK